MNTWITGTVINIKKWTDKLFSLYIHANISPFIAGQFTKLSLHINGKKIQRAYSYVNAPNNSILEFYIVKISNGIFSPILNKLTIGNKIMISKYSNGFLIINEIPKCESLWMIATGTAIGPYLSMLQDYNSMNRFKYLILVYAVRYLVDLNYINLIKKLQKKYINKLYVQTIVSREKHKKSLFGRIPNLINSGELEDSIGLYLNNKSHIMLCGNPKMVYDTKNVLLHNRNMRIHLRRIPGQISTEQYWK